MYQKILVPMALDHGISDKTLAVANALKSEGGEIIALHVREALQGTVSLYVDEALAQKGFDEAKAMMAKKLAAVDGVEPKIVTGHTYRTIIEYAENHRIDCIVIGSHRPELSDYLLGSTAARVVRHAPCAVHVYRTN